jgi:hypothetical protein
VAVRGCGAQGTRVGWGQRWRQAHLQWTTTGPASGGLHVFTLRRKARKGVGYSGTPWSGHAVNWKWRTSRFSLEPFWRPQRCHRGRHHGLRTLSRTSALSVCVWFLWDLTDNTDPTYVHPSHLSQLTVGGSVLPGVLATTWGSPSPPSPPTPNTSADTVSSASHIWPKPAASHAPNVQTSNHCPGSVPPTTKACPPPASRGHSEH